MHFRTSLRLANLIAFDEFGDGDDSVQDAFEKWFPLIPSVNSLVCGLSHRLPVLQDVILFVVVLDKITRDTPD
jgi:hypothetical protein